LNRQRGYLPDHVLLLSGQLNAIKISRRQRHIAAEPIRARAVQGIVNDGRIEQICAICVNQCSSTRSTGDCQPPRLSNGLTSPVARARCTQRPRQATEYVAGAGEHSPA
jgi:hypothetical protein